MKFRPFLYFSLWSFLSVLLILPPSWLEAVNECSEARLKLPQNCSRTALTLVNTLPSGWIPPINDQPSNVFPTFETGHVGSSSDLVILMPEWREGQTAATLTETEVQWRVEMFFSKLHPEAEKTLQIFSEKNDTGFYIPTG